jgi:hypothetical protein
VFVTSTGKFPAASPWFHRRAIGDSILSEATLHGVGQNRPMRRHFGGFSILIIGRKPKSAGLNLEDSPHVIRFLCAKTPNEDLMMKCIWNSHRLFAHAPEAKALRDAIQRVGGASLAVQ